MYLNDFNSDAIQIQTIAHSDVTRLYNNHKKKHKDITTSVWTAF
jgi:hypothetical protein